MQNIKAYRARSHVGFMISLLSGRATRLKRRRSWSSLTVQVPCAVVTAIPNFLYGTLSDFKCDDQESCPNNLLFLT